MIHKNIFDPEISQLLSPQPRSLLELHEWLPVRSVELTVMLRRSARSRNLGHISPRQYRTLSQRTITKEHTQRSPLSLQGIGTFAFSDMLLQIGAGQLVGSWVQLLKVGNMVLFTCPLREADRVLLVDRSCFEAVDLASALRPDVLASSSSLNFCLIAALAYGHFAIQALDHFTDDTLAVWLTHEEILNYEDNPVQTCSLCSDLVAQIEAHTRPHFLPLTAASTV
jgi:hypothetical protein